MEGVKGTAKSSLPLERERVLAFTKTSEHDQELPAVPGGGGGYSDIFICISSDHFPVHFFSGVGGGVGV